MKLALSVLAILILVFSLIGFPQPASAQMQDGVNFNCSGQAIDVALTEGPGWTNEGSDLFFGLDVVCFSFLPVVVQLDILSPSNVVVATKSATYSAHAGAKRSLALTYTVPCGGPAGNYKYRVTLYDNTSGSPVLCGTYTSTHFTSVSSPSAC